MIFAILILILLQMLGRVVEIVIPGIDDFAGYAVVASAFMGLAATMHEHGHIRVQLLLQRLPQRLADQCELACGVVGVVTVAFMLYCAIDFVHDSYILHEVAGGLLATPLWIVQSPLVAGTGLMLISMLEFTINAAGVVFKPQSRHFQRYQVSAAAGE